MKGFFKWCPLAPPSSYPNSVASVANLVGIFAGLAAIAIMLLGLKTGFWLYFPLILSVFLFGLPHGAVDHLVMIGLARKRLSLGGLTIVCSLYLCLVLSFLLLWWISPLTALSLFLFFTVYHWGKADLAFEILSRNGASQPAPYLLRWSHLLLRGFFPIGTPFLAFPEATEAFIISCTSSFGVDFVLNPGVRAALFVSLVVLLLGEALYLKTLGSQRMQRAAEDLGLLIYFSLVPPLLAIGLYFCLWHGFRHVLRLVHYDLNQGAAGSLVQSLNRFYTQALPFTLASLVIVLATTLILPQVTRFDQSIGIYFVVISSLTFPHLCVVKWMDTREGF